MKPEYRAWNDIDKTMIEWSTIKAFNSLLVNLMTGNIKHHILMQCIGIKDMNMKKVFDGDIVEAEVESAYGWKKIKGVVVYSEEDLEWQIEQDDDDFWPVCSFVIVNKRTVKVVGNKFENKDMIRFLNE